MRTSATMNDQPTATTGPLIRTVLNEQGIASIAYSFPVEGENDLHFVYSLDAALEVGLSFINAVYAARAEQALFVIGKQKSLSVEDLIKWMRSGK